jgi:hypothetical protein
VCFIIFSNGPSGPTASGKPTQGAPYGGDLVDVDRRHVGDGAEAGDVLRGCL